MHELFEHTADLGLRATAPDLGALFAEMAACLLSAVVEDPTSVCAEREVWIDLEGADKEYLLFDWLNRLLMHFEADRLLFSKFDVRIKDDGLFGAAWGEEYDPERHVLAHEVKAITYHGLKVETTADGWLAEAIVDI